MGRLVWPLAGFAAAAAVILYAGTAQVSKRTVWIVPYDCQQTLRVQPGDVIEVWSEPLAVIPQNLESRFRASKVGGGVELVGEALPHKEGTMERLFFFKAFEVGPATLRVDLIGGDGAVRETRSYRVEVVGEEAEE